MKKGITSILFIASLFFATAQSTGKYQIKFLEINKSNSDYGLAILDNNQLIFTSADTKIKTARKNYNPRKDLFIGDIDFDGEIKNIKPVKSNIDTKFNENGVAYTSDKKTVYFSRNKYVKKLARQNLAKNKKLILYKADVDPDGNWTNIEKLPFNKKAYSSGLPVLNKDNTKLYFVSDRLPSKGKTDIFVVDILSNGKFGKPKNLGSNVNTTGNETTPFITDEEILYFASDGHPGQGNLDVFAVEIYEESTSEIYQLASPINSINDDFAYIVNKDNNQGFFTSNRLQGKGFNDLYGFTLEEDIRPGECFITVDGKVKDKESLDAIAGATVDLYNMNGELLESVSTYDDGTYKFTVSCAKEYKLIASNEKYKKDEKRIEILEENYHSALHTNLVLTRLIEEKKAIKKLQPIYYDFDDATITEVAAKEMNRIVEIMTDNPNLIIEASSFTDSRGTNVYNKKLSQERAKAAIEYLKSKGINIQRIKSHSYGEEKLINQCVNGIECDDEAHQMNRRTEFNFVNIQSVSRRKSIYRRKTRLAETPTKKKIKPVVKKEVINREIQTESKIASVETKDVESKKIEKPSTKKVVKEEVIVNYRSSIVAVDKKNNKALNYIENEKLKVLNNITALEKKYELAIGKFTYTSDSLSVEKKNIAALKTEVIEMEETGWSNVINYKNRLHHFDKRYVELTNKNNNISYANNGNLSRTDLNDKEILEQSLKINNIEVIAMKIGSKGKYQVTNNANKTDLIKVKFKLLHNDKIASGKKDAHIIVQNPKGKVTEAKGIFTLRDTNVEKKYTDHTIIEYNKNDIDVTVYIERKGKNYEKGIYPIKLFLEGQLVGVSNLNLASAF